MLKQLVILVFFTSAVILAGCANTQTEFMIVDQREVLGEVFVESTGLVDNCIGTDTLMQDIAAKREFRHSMQIRLNPDANLDRQQVEQKILDAYNLPSATGEKLCIIPADVPAGKSYQYDIEWTQVLREGNIEEGTTPGSGNILGTYSVVIDLQCQVVGANVARSCE